MKISGLSLEIRKHRGIRGELVDNFEDTKQNLSIIRRLHITSNEISFFSDAKR